MPKYAQQKQLNISYPYSLRFILTLELYKDLTIKKKLI